MKKKKSCSLMCLWCALLIALAQVNWRNALVAQEKFEGLAKSFGHLVKGKTDRWFLYIFNCTSIKWSHSTQVHTKWEGRNQHAPFWNLELLNIAFPWQIKAPEETTIIGWRECSKKSVQQGRSPFGARSVRSVREHGKMARTPLAAFFNLPNL